MFILKRYYKFYKSNGLIKSIFKIITSPLRIIYKQIYKNNKKKIFSKNSQKERFELIYKTNFWSSKESVSGLGSEICVLKKTIHNLEQAQVATLPSFLDPKESPLLLLSGVPVRIVYLCQLENLSITSPLKPEVLKSEAFKAL